MLGSVTHRFNLDVQELLDGKSSLLSRVHAIMNKLLNLIPAAQLQKHTHFAAILNMKTCWSSTYEIVIRDQRIRDFLPSRENEENDMLFLSKREELYIDELCQTLRDLESATRSLQIDSLTVCDARHLFHEVLLS